MTPSPTSPCNSTYTDHQNIEQTKEQQPWQCSSVLVVVEVKKKCKHNTAAPRRKNIIKNCEISCSMEKKLPLSLSRLRPSAHTSTKYTHNSPTGLLEHGQRGASDPRHFTKPTSAVLSFLFVARSPTVTSCPRQGWSPERHRLRRYLPRTRRRDTKNDM